jgi:isopentenyldiphosphate isomerase
VDKQRWEALGLGGQARYLAEANRLDAEAYSFLLEDKRGRWLIARLAEENYLWATTFTNDAESYFREGKRAAVLVLFQKIRRAGARLGQLLLLAETERQDRAEALCREIMSRQGED